MAMLLERLMTASSCPAIPPKRLSRIWRRSRTTGQLPRWLPYHEFPKASGVRNELSIMNKTGQMEGIRTDAAIFAVGATKWIVVSFTQGSIDKGYSLDHEGNLLNARTGLAIFDAWGRPSMKKD